LLILSRAAAYQPDLIIWFVTLESFPAGKQLASPILQHNPQAARSLIAAHGLRLDPDDPAFVAPSFWEQTLIGQRRALADLFRLQLYGVMWAVTGVDQFYPPSYDPPQWDLDADEGFHGLQPPTLNERDLAFDVLEAGVALAAPTPILFVNEPVFISQGQNSDLRYNFFYPRWAYDQYRQLFAALGQARGWRTLDLWNLIPAEEFTNSAIHLSPRGEAQLAEAVGAEILKIVSEK
jgi:hypothetical protein